MLDRYPGGKEALLDEVRAGRTSPEVAACVLAGQKVCGAPSPPLPTLTLTPTPNANPNRQPQPQPYLYTNL